MYSHYLISSTLSRDTMLNMAKAELEFISDADMCLFFEKDTRGEDSYISKRYRNVNKKC